MSDSGRFFHHVKPIDSAEALFEDLGLEDEEGGDMAALLGVLELAFRAGRLKAKRQFLLRRWDAGLLAVLTHAKGRDS